MRRLLARSVDWILAALLGQEKPVASASPDSAHEAQGRRILAARPRRLEILSEIRDRMISIPMEDRSALVDRVAARFAMYVVDLPASESNHGAEAFGLLDHSLEVARNAVGELVRPGFRVSEDPAMNHRDQPIWAYSGFVLSLLHDVGKVMDLDVSVGQNGAAWNPIEEPLVAYLGRHRLDASGREAWRWKEGRGLNGHVPKGNALAPLILPDESKRLLGPRLRVLLSTFVRSYVEGKEDWAKGPAGRVVLTVRHWDGVHAEHALNAGQAHPASNARHAPPFSAESKGPESAVATSTPPPAPASAAAGPQAPVDTSKPSPEALKPSPSPQKAKTQATEPKRYVLARELTPEEVRLRDELSPDRLIETIRSWVRAGNVSRNGVHADMFVCSEYVWLRFPQALKGIVESVKLKWTAYLGRDALAALLKHPLVAPLSRTEVLVSATPTGRKEDVRQLIRIKAAGFLPSKEMETLGLWAPGMTVVGASTPADTSEGARLIPMRRAG
jgi:hypothetical protein